MKPIDLSHMRVIDLSQNWDVNTPSPPLLPRMKGLPSSGLSALPSKKWVDSSSRLHCMLGRTWTPRCTLSPMVRTLAVFRWTSWWGQG